jgi:hypothetical protein
MLGTHVNGAVVLEDTVAHSGSRIGRLSLSTLVINLRLIVGRQLRSLRVIKKEDNAESDMLY